MATTILLILLSISTAALAVSLWLTVQYGKKRLEAYKQNLEKHQKRMDQQTSRLNILTRSLPNLQTLTSTRLSS
jgi:hypothetical protein